MKSMLFIATVFVAISVYQVAGKYRLKTMELKCLKILYKQIFHFSFNLT